MARPSRKLARITNELPTVAPGDYEAMVTDDFLANYYARVRQETRENYQASFLNKLQDMKATGANFVAGLPVDDFPRALLWYAVYKPFWNANAASAGGPS